jgi:phage antirepressor YoqD-like protein
MNPDSTRLTVPETARLLGMDKDTLMAWLRSSKPPPWGSYIREPGKQRGTYYIHRQRFAVWNRGADMQNPRMGGDGENLIKFPMAG